MGTEDDTTRTSATTYMPEYQKRIWADHADRLGMTQSEFIRTMVQAGRRGFDPDTENRSSETSGDTADNTAEDLEQRVERALADREYLRWEELVEVLTDDIENRLEAALETLQAENRVRYSGREGGYTLIEDDT